MFKKVLQIAFALFMLQSCNNGTNGITRNDQIDAKTRQQIKILNDQLFTALRTGNAQEIGNLMSDTLKKTTSDNFGLGIPQMKEIMHAKGFDVLNEYQVRNIVAGAITSIPDSNYTFTFTASNQQAYVSLLTTNTRDNKLLLTVVYGKYGDNWKISTLHFGQYSYFQKTSDYYYQLAKASYAQQHLVDAANYMGVAKGCLQPAGALLQYNNAKQIDSFYTRIITETNTKYKLPVTLTGIHTQPRIFKIDPFGTTEGFFPMVYYVSAINLQDTTALKAENEQVKKQVDSIFTGINQNKRYVFYWAMDSLPTGQNKPAHKAFIDKVGE